MNQVAVEVTRAAEGGDWFMAGKKKGAVRPLSFRIQ